MVMAGITHNKEPAVSGSHLTVLAPDFSWPYIHPPFLEHESSANRKSAYPSGVSEKTFQEVFFLKEL